MEIELKSLVIGAMVGAFLCAMTFIGLYQVDNPGRVTVEIAELIIKQARAECVNTDRPFRIEGAGNYVTAVCGRH